MAKPIFLVGFSKDVPYEAVDVISNTLGRKLSDYHVLCYQHQGIEIQYKVLNADKMNALKWNQLKAMAAEAMQTVMPSKEDMEAITPPPAPAKKGMLARCANMLKNIFTPYDRSK
jgi:hypothetical protein